LRVLTVFIGQERFFDQLAEIILLHAPVTITPAKARCSRCPIYPRLARARVCPRAPKGGHGAPPTSTGSLAADVAGLPIRGFGAVVVASHGRE